MPLGRFDGRPAPPFGTLLGSGLDARQFTELSTLSDDTLATPNHRFFIRTSFSDANARPGPWTIRLAGSTQRPVDVPLDSLASLVRPMGTCLIECAGNVDPANFGLMSSADWSGIPIGALLDRAQPRSGSWRVKVTGVDDEKRASRTSVPGASWIFSRDDLERAGAFLATAMNGAELPRDHGFPARLIVPGWYGCACIKWVSQIDLVADDAQPTMQMREFAARTHQNGMPALAREFEPAVIDTAAMAVRVEQWIADGRVTYRVVGIMWGGSTPTNALAIRFKHNQPFVPVSRCPLAASTHTWSMWSHVWRPESPGRYQIVLRVDDPAIRTRRLDVFFYIREVDIDEV
jgi:DMSO/TMAO reductase YedYZ molybdopterin-dependent catalytic subunit